MKFILGMPTFELDSSLIKVEPIKYKLIIGIFIGLISTLILDFIIDLFIFQKNLDFQIISKLHFFFLVLPLHELLHLVFFPRLRNCIVGISFQKMVFYVSTIDFITKKRLLLAALAPLFILTILPFSILFIHQSEFLANILLLNMIGSGVDIITIFEIIRLPKKREFKFIGAELYMRN